MIHSDPRPAPVAAIGSGYVSLGGLWLKYMARGGKADVLELDAYIRGVPLLHVEIVYTTLKEIPPAIPTTGGSAPRRSVKRAAIAPTWSASKRLQTVLKHWPLSPLDGPARTWHAPNG